MLLTESVPLWCCVFCVLCPVFCADSKLPVEMVIRDLGSPRWAGDGNRSHFLRSEMKYQTPNSGRHGRLKRRLAFSVIFDFITVDNLLDLESSIISKIIVVAYLLPAVISSINFNTISWWFVEPRQFNWHRSPLTSAGVGVEVESHKTS